MSTSWWHSFRTDRFISLLCGGEVESIRDVIAFPKSTAGEEIMTGAPGVVQQQLDEYHIFTRNNEKCFLFFIIFVFIRMQLLFDLILFLKK